MLKRDEIIGPSCLTRAADDEPIFVLRANDELAPETVRMWAMYYHEKNFNDGTLTPARFDKYKEALQLADKMEEWRKDNVAMESF